MNKLALIVADTSPIIHLASCRLLHLFNKTTRFIMTDIVQIEATRQGKPFSEKITEWINGGVKDGTIVIEKTSTGETLKTAMQSNPDYRQKDGGERANLDWLLDKINNCQNHAMVIYENGKVPSMIQKWDMDANISILTTKAFLNYCEKQSLIDDADKVWKEMIDKNV